MEIDYIMKEVVENLPGYRGVISSEEASELKKQVMGRVKPIFTERDKIPHNNPFSRFRF